MLRCGPPSLPKKTHPWGEQVLTSGLECEVPTICFPYREEGQNVVEFCLDFVVKLRNERGASDALPKVLRRPHPVPRRSPQSSARFARRCGSSARERARGRV